MKEIHVLAICVVSSLNSGSFIFRIKYMYDTIMKLSWAVVPVHTQIDNIDVLAELVA